MVLVRSNSLFGGSSFTLVLFPVLMRLKVMSVAAALSAGTAVWKEPRGVRRLAEAPPVERDGQQEPSIATTRTGPTYPEETIRSRLEFLSIYGLGSPPNAGVELRRRCANAHEAAAGR